MTDKSGEIIELSEKTDRYKTIRFSWGDVNYVFGAECSVEFEKNDVLVRKVFARNVWPRHVYEHVDDQEFGVRFEYVSQTGSWVHGLISGNAFVDKNSGRRACADASADGVDVETGSEHHLAYALGRWKKACEAEVVRVTRVNGWKKNRKVYVNGKSTFGEGGWHVDESVLAIKRRSQRAGKVEDWIAAVDQEITTPALRAALGVSLAGPFIEFLQLTPFILHIYGNSSCGKSTAGRVAASVWSSPSAKRNGLFQLWKNSLGGFEILASSADGACLVLDELGTFNGTSQQFADLVHLLTGMSGKVTMTQHRNERESNSWAITGVSTGEISMKARIGDHLQGGQMVRMIDLDVNPDEVTIDAAHADRVRRKFTASYGIAGDVWVKHLVDLGQEAVTLADEHLADWRNRLAGHNDDTAEGGRILSHVHLIGAAIGLARDAGIIPWDESEDAEMLNWLAQRIMGDRDDNKTTNERALENWYTKIDTKPGAFPFENETGPRKELFGYSRKFKSKFGDEDMREIWTSERMIKKSGLTTESAVTARKWIQWCIGKGYCREEDNARFAGKQRNWKVFPVDQGADVELGRDHDDKGDDLLF